MSRPGIGAEAQRRKQEEAKRLSEALRDNLARRKAQSRARVDSSDTSAKAQFVSEDGDGNG